MNYSEVYRGLGIDSELRERVLDTYRSIGGTFDSWKDPDKERMAKAISTIEDEIEHEGRNLKYQSCREPLQAIRRRLEDEIELNASYSTPPTDDTLALPVDSPPVSVILES
jgi:hypothetical protein